MVSQNKYQGVYMNTKFPASNNIKLKMFGIQSNITRHAKKQEMTDIESEERNRSKQTKMMLELASKVIKGGIAFHMVNK